MAQTDMARTDHAGGAARRAVTVAGGAVAALVLWTLTGPVAGHTPSAETGGEIQQVGAVAVAAGALVAGLAAWALLAVLERTVGRPARAWTTTAAAVLALSLAGPLGGAADTASMAALTGMHLLVGAVLIAGLGTSARGRRGGPRAAR
ncbi:DUF6069 family protein [Actinomadura livida]|uniref:Uncharacterized protein n=1 Tax=Actinomadura livida TaxID=79909 RepID=A0A7W7MYS7_9ACTN|nr:MULTISPECIES: DUF6069 family protein [Actinomadura]MBB4775279.1 hypothetical protein [Actinomadura catellatispora]GGT89169.1 hypothetical protein GCM10010208_09930 [Actinomadura livida]